MYGLGIAGCLAAWLLDDDGNAHWGYEGGGGGGRGGYKPRAPLGVGSRISQLTYGKYDLGACEFFFLFSGLGREREMRKLRIKD